jgi:hypothetical protein
LANAGFSFYSILTADSEVGWLSKTSATVTATRWSLALIGSWHVLGHYSLVGFQYPELAWTASLSYVNLFCDFQGKFDHNDKRNVKK